MALSVDKQEEFYREIMVLYDLTEELVDTIEVEFKQPQPLDVEVFLPAIQFVQSGTDTFVDTYLTYVEEDKVNRKQMRKLQAAIRKIFSNIMIVTQKIEKVVS